MSQPHLDLALRGHVALVTGASGGIGQATCRLLADLGCSIGVHYNSDEGTARDLTRELTDRYASTSGAKFHAVKADMGDYAEVTSPPRALLHCRTHSSRYARCTLRSRNVLAISLSL